MTHLDRAIYTNLEILFSMLPGIRDGKPDAIHDARVATRRLRAAVPVVWGLRPEDDWGEGAETLRTLGRALGGVRDVDVQLKALDSLETRVPAAARALVALRRELAGRQWSQRRRLIKTLEKLPLDTLANLRFRAPRLSLRPDARRNVLRRALNDRAAFLSEAVENASGVYFPKRAHRVRVGVKKLRYLLELLPAADRPRRALKRLKRVQELLGRVHDQQTLMDRIDDVKRASDEPQHYDPLLASLAADVQDQYAEYLRERECINHVADDVTRAIGGNGRYAAVARGLFAAGLAAAPAAIVGAAGVLYGRRVPTTQEPGRPRREPISMRAATADADADADADAQERDQSLVAARK